MTSIYISMKDHEGRRLIVDGSLDLLNQLRGVLFPSQPPIVAEAPKVEEAPPLDKEEWAAQFTAGIYKLDLDKRSRNAILRPIAAILEPEKYYWYVSSGSIEFFSDVDRLIPFEEWIKRVSVGKVDFSRGRNIGKKSAALYQEAAILYLAEKERKAQNVPSA